MQSNMHRDVNHVKGKESYQNEKGDKLKSTWGHYAVQNSKCP